MASRLHYKIKKAINEHKKNFEKAGKDDVKKAASFLSRRNLKVNPVKFANASKELGVGFDKILEIIEANKGAGDI